MNIPDNVHPSVQRNYERYVGLCEAFGVRPVDISDPDPNRWIRHYEVLNKRNQLKRRK